jgi:hypothetical protein
MDAIKLLLGRFKDYLPEELVFRRLVCEVILEKTGVALTPKDLNLSGGAIYIKAKPIAKSEIFIKRELILDALEKRLDGLRKTPERLI